MFRKPLSIAISSAISLCGLIFSMTASAEEQEEKAKEGEIMEEIITTGSRIERTNLDSPAPVTVLDSESLKISSNSNLADTLFELPSTGVPGVSQTNSNFTVFAGGIATVDLRNLGTTRTLVLVNGRRHVAGDIDNPSVVDLNSIPNEFIDRIEVITGGASAVYGSEAMAGVINIITKEDFEGMSVSTRYGSSEKSDGQDAKISITGGSPFADGKGHAMFNIGYQDLSSVESSDRPLSATDNFFGDFSSFSSFAPKGSVLARDGNAFTLDESTGLWNKPFVSSEDGFNRAAFRKIQLPLKRKNASIDIKYELNDSTNVFLESSFTQTTSDSNLEPTITGLFLTVGDEDLTLPGDYPFFPQEMIDDVFGGNIDADENIFFLKRFTEVGPRKTMPKRDTFRIAFGLDGELNNGMKWDTYYQYGVTDAALNRTGDFNTFFFQQGLNLEADPDNAGGYRCKDPLARSLGCVPIDVFGEGSISPEAVAYVRVPATSGAELKQQVFAANLAGDLYEFGGNTMQFATGFEYRKEQYERTTDALAAAGLSSSNASSPVSGSYDVWEVYGELNIPLLQGATAADYLGFDLAYRYGDYSTVGGVGQWKAGFQWAPWEDLRIRITQSQAVRAPNVAELFDPGSETFESFTDPCTNGGIGGDGSTQSNCASVGIAPGFDPGVNGSSAGGFQSGNPNLKEETSDSITMGFVYTPSWANGLSFSMDYFDIEIEDAVELINPQIKLDECYAAADFPNNVFCDGITRDPSIGNIIKRLNFGFENIGLLTTKGVDVELRWVFDAASLGMGDGSFMWSWLGTYTDEWEREIFGEIENNLREPGFNKVKWNNRLSWMNGPWVVSWTWRYLGKGNADNSPSFLGDPLNVVTAESYHDLNARYVFDGDTTYELSFGLNNVMDNDAPYIPEPSENTVTGTGTAADVYDPIGRYFYAGVEVRF